MRLSTFHFKKEIPNIVPSIKHFMRHNKNDLLMGAALGVAGLMGIEKLIRKSVPVVTNIAIPQFQETIDEYKSEPIISTLESLSKAKDLWENIGDPLVNRRY